MTILVIILAEAQEPKIYYCVIPFSADWWHYWYSVASVVIFCRLWRMYCGWTVRPLSKSYYWQHVGSEKSIGTKMNDLDHRLEVVSRSCQPLCDIRRWITRKPLEIEAWFKRTTNRKWHIGYQIITWPMTSRRCCRGSTVGYPSDSLASFYSFSLLLICEIAQNTFTF